MSDEKPKVQQPTATPRTYLVSSEQLMDIMRYLMTIAVLLGQLYVGIGYRVMTTSILELIEINKINVNSHIN